MIKYSFCKVSTMFSNGKGTMERDFFPWSKTWKTVRQTRNQVAASAHKGATVPLWTNYVKHHNDRTVVSQLRRMCDEKGGSVCHLVSECKKLAHKHIHIGNCVSYSSLKGWEGGISIYQKVLSYFGIWLSNWPDNVVEARGPDIIVLNKTENKSWLWRLLSLGIVGYMKRNLKKTKNIRIWNGRLDWECGV